jgi:hypothetical protein
MGYQIDYGVRRLTPKGDSELMVRGRAGLGGPAISELQLNAGDLGDGH